MEPRRKETKTKKYECFQLCPGHSVLSPAKVNLPIGFAGMHLATLSQWCHPLSHHPTHSSCYIALLPKEASEDIWFSCPRARTQWPSASHIWSARHFHVSSFWFVQYSSEKWAGMIWAHMGYSDVLVSGLAILRTQPEPWDYHATWRSCPSGQLTSLNSHYCLDSL